MFKRLLTVALLGLMAVSSALAESCERDCAAPPPPAAPAHHGGHGHAGHDSAPGVAVSAAACGMPSALAQATTITVTLRVQQPATAAVAPAVAPDIQAEALRAGEVAPVARSSPLLVRPLRI